MIDFPANPVKGQAFSPGTGSIYVFDGTAWNLAPVVLKTAEQRNRIINGNMMISQENGNNAVTVSGGYAADMFNTYFSGTMSLSSQRVQVETPKGSNDRYRVSVAVADSSLTTTDYAAIYHRIEGYNVADFNYGVADAQQAVLRFGWKAPAGTYAVSVHNAAANRSYVTTFTISAAQANTDTEQVIVIPGDVTGTWAVDTSIGIEIMWALAAGPTYGAPVTGWQAGHFVGLAGQFNFAGGSNVAELFDVSFHRDPDKTGIAPAWERPDLQTEIMKCRRYWEPWRVNHRFDAGTGGASVTDSAFFQFVPKRAVPTCAMANHAGSNYSSQNVGSIWIEGFQVLWAWTSAGPIAREFTAVGTVNARM